MLSALERWLDGGEAPGAILSVKRENGAIVAQRPLCPYPRAAHYIGSGDPKRASSFRCRLPLQK
jgi:feruloyl esterase